MKITREDNYPRNFYALNQVVRCPNCNSMHDKASWPIDWGTTEDVAKELETNNIFGSCEFCGAENVFQLTPDGVVVRIKCN